MIDFHCHIDLFPDPKAVLDECEARGIYVLAVTTTPRAWAGTCQIIGKRSRIRPAVGLHPELVSERHSELPMLIELMKSTRYVGEVGIDGGPDHRKHLDLQSEVFTGVLEACARYGGRVLSIHSRGAAKEVLDALIKVPAVGTPVLHWFSGGIGELGRADDCGCWFSVGPAMLRSAKGRRLLELMPRDRVLTESDGPFAQDRGVPIRPWEIDVAVGVIAEVWGTTISGASQQLDENFKRLTSAAQLYPVS